MTRNNITSELLADLKTKAQAATPGPWCTCLNAEKVMSRPHPDWGCVYADVQSCKTGEVLEACQLLRVNGNLVSEEEETYAREKFFTEGIRTNPGLMGANAEYIAAANPTVVLALIAEIENIRSRMSDVEYSRKVTGQSLYELLSEAHARAERLEKEAQWLAKHCEGEEQCPYLALQWGETHAPKWCNALDTIEDGFECFEDPVDCWRKVAREAAAEQKA